MPETVTASRPLALLREKRLGAPVWLWLAGGLGLLLVVLWIRRSKASTASTEAASGYEMTPYGQAAPPIFIVPQAATPGVNIQLPGTAPEAPPAGGAPPPAQPPTTSAPNEVSAPGPSVNLYDWIADLNKKYNLNLTFTQLFGDANGVGAMNPGYRKYIGWKPGPPNSNYKIPYFNPNWSGRGLGIPQVRIR